MFQSNFEVAGRRIFQSKCENILFTYCTCVCTYPIYAYILFVYYTHAYIFYLLCVCVRVSHAVCPQHSRPPSGERSGILKGCEEALDKNSFARPEATASLFCKVRAVPQTLR